MHCNTSQGHFRHAQFVPEVVLGIDQDMGDCDSMRITVEKFTDLLCIRFPKKASKTNDINPLCIKGALVGFYW